MGLAEHDRRDLCLGHAFRQHRRCGDCRLAWHARGRCASSEDVKGIDVALLVPIYNEVPPDVFGNAVAMLHDLAARNGPHNYTLFVLSDTRDEAIAAQEWQAFEDLRKHSP